MNVTNALIGNTSRSAKNVNVVSALPVTVLVGGDSLFTVDEYVGMWAVRADDQIAAINSVSSKM